ncbi:MAG: SGNH/GDSL hydrolase family protein [Pseudomonadota bacterium]|nr:SGNH/GDSL hydrolase family protein [Pseudomonadota bacterium]
MEENTPTSTKKNELIVLIAAVLAIAAALAINEWTLGWWSCPDGYFAPDDRLRIAAFQGLCLLGGVLLLLFRRKALAVNILLSAVTVLVCFFLGEALMRIFHPQIGGRTEQEVFFTYDETLGWRFIPGKSGLLVSKHEYEQVITINAAGFRDRERLLAKGPKTKRVAVIGDSFTAGLGVKDTEAFTAVLEASLPGAVEVLNFGVNGFGPTQECLLLTARVLPYRPDLVSMVFYIGNDFDDTTNLTAWIDGYQRPRAVLDDRGRIRFTNIPVPKTSRPRNELQRTCSLPRSHLIDFLDRIIHQRRDKYALDVLPPEVRLCRKELDPSLKEALPLLRGVLEETDARCRRRGSRFALVLAPTVTQIHPDIYWQKIKKVYNLREEDYDLLLPNKIVAGIASDLGIPVLDLTPALRAEADRGAELYYYKNRHWNPAGHRVVARELAAWIETRKLLTE